MRIAYVVKNFDPTHGGSERDAYNSALGLAALGHRVTVFSQRSSVPPQQLPEGVRLVEIPKIRSLAKHGRERFAEASRRAIRNVEEWDVLEAFARTPVANTFRVCGGVHKSYIQDIAPYRSKYGAFWDTYSSKSRRNSRLESEIFSRPDVSYIANSERTRSQIVREYDVAPERIRLVYPSVNVSQFNPEKSAELRSVSRSHWSISENDVVITFVGFSFFLKGLKYVLETAAVLQRSGISIRVLVAGAGNPRSYQKRAGELGIQERVTFLGKLEDVSKVLAASDFFMLPSIYEPFGLAALEAMACGVPSIISQQSGVAEIVVNKRDCLVLERPDDVNSSVEFISELLEDPQARQKLALRSIAVAQRYDANRYAAELFECYKEIVRERATT